ncbi:MAG: nucleoside monophosphate kinase [Parcubacteria group bacterium]|nr:nucleoside monophosphate kinase [Parcubacteria group bacterium]
MAPRVNTILMLGKTGSGKETQARLLQKKLNFKLFSSGDRFRAIQEMNTELGNRIRKDMDNGYLMPDWLSTYIFQEGLFQLKTGEGIIFEGTARKLPEAKAFDIIANWLGRTAYVCIHLVVPDEEVVARQLKRGRKDSNTKEKIQTRLNEYYKYTAAVIDFFRAHNKIVDINGVGSVEKIHDDIVLKLKL